jgi:zinc/manganese transport system permease protein
MGLTEMLRLMLWPLVACLTLPWLLVYLGLHIVRRGVIFVDLALAQVAALGTCVALLLGHDVHDWRSYAWSLGFTLLGAVVFTLTHGNRARVPQEALIGVVYVVAAAAAILLLSKSAEGKEELQRSLVGELLVVSPGEIARTLALYVAIGAVHVVFRAKFVALAWEADPASPRTRGLAARGWDFLFYVLFGLAVTAFVHLGGVLLTFSYLIVPAICGLYLARSLRGQLLVGWAAAIVASLGSMYATVKADLPIGAAIVCGLGLLLLAVQLAVACGWSGRSSAS